MNTSSHNGGPWVPIIVALIGAAGLVIAAWIGVQYGQARGEEEAFATVVAQQTAAATNTPPIEQPTAQPTPTIPSPEQPTLPTQPTTSPSESNQGVTPDTSIDCSKMIEVIPHHPPSLGVDWQLEAISEDRIIHIWSNHWDPNLPEFKFFLPAGQTATFMSGGGSEWRAQPGCPGTAKVVYQRDTFQEISLEQYQTYIDNKLDF